MDDCTLLIRHLFRRPASESSCTTNPETFARMRRKPGAAAATLAEESECSALVPTGCHGDIRACRHNACAMLYVGTTYCATGTATSAIPVQGSA